jgi:DNA-binding beta-propeller fold protein YncE
MDTMRQFFPRGELLRQWGPSLRSAPQNHMDWHSLPMEGCWPQPNNGTSPFSVTLISGINSGAPQAKLVRLDSTFQGVAFSKDGFRFYASAGEDGLVWVGDSVRGNILAVVNLNTSAHTLTGPIDPQTTPPGKFKGTFPGAMSLDSDGHFLYVVDQGGFRVHVIDTTKIDAFNHGIGASDPNNFAAVTGAVKVGRYPFSVAISHTVPFGEPCRHLPI